jgi:glucose-1-phosphate thymidylyltransferase
LANDSLKIVIPMAGYGTRLRPQTWSKPKPLVTAAGKTILGHVFDILQTAGDPDKQEFIFITGYLGDQVEAFMEEHYPRMKASYILQAERHGQSHAVAMARDLIEGPTLIVFVDTLIDTNLSFLQNEEADVVLWVKQVEDPRRFGVAELDANGKVVNLIEKPDDIRLNNAIVGFYYFKHGEDLIAAIDEQIEKNIRTKGEYFLADAMKILLDKGVNMRVQQVDVWLDAGLPETVLETNRYLLEHGRDNTAIAARRDRVTIVPPVYIHPSAHIVKSTIGPHVSIGEGCRIYGSMIEDSVLERDVEVNDSRIIGSLIGSRAKINGMRGCLNIGSDASIDNCMF